MQALSVDNDKRKKSLLLEELEHYGITFEVNEALEVSEERLRTLLQEVESKHELMEESANDVLDNKREEIKKTTGFEIKTKLLTGHISDSIIDFAAKEKVDLIVIGNVGRSGISKIRTLGSVSRSVSERAPCPVMIIH